MRRYSLVLAWLLVGSVVVSGCSLGGKTDPARTGTARGVAGKNFYVNLFTPPVGGIVKSGEATPRISCGASSYTVQGGQYVYASYADGAACGQTLYPWTTDGKAAAADGSNLTRVVLRPLPQGTNAFLGWAGDCAGLGDCTLTPGADKTVVALFGKPGSGHPNLMDPALHGPLFLGNVAGGNALDCASCHGATYAGKGIAPSCNACHAAAGVPSWQTTCTFCHGAPPADGVHPAVAGTYPGNLPRCASCHGTTVDAAGLIIAGGTHRNGHVEAAGHPAGWSNPAVHSAAANADITACTACHGADYAGQGSIPSCNACHAAAGWADWRDNCSFCHGLRNATTQASNTFAAHPEWAAPPDDLIGRRTGTNGAATGAHQAHVAANGTRSPIPCSECHDVPTSSTQRHFGLQLPFGPISRTGGAVPTWDPATLTCASTYCHGNFSFGAVQGSAAAPTWGGSPIGCASCHAMPPAGHLPVNGAAASCAACHPDTVLQNGAIDLSKGRHVNGQKDVSGGACDSCHWFPYPSAVPPAVPWAATGAHLAHYGLTAGQGSTGYGDLETLQVKFPVGAPTSTGYAFGCGNCHPIQVDQHSMLTGGDAKVVLYEAAAPAASLKARNATTAAYAPAARTCSGVYCHGGVAATPAWTGGSLACNGCHGTSTPSGLPDYASGSPKANSHQAHDFACSTCHLATTASAGTIASSARHVNGGLDVTAGPGVTFSYTYAATGGTCSNVSCHGGGSATWGPVESHVAALGTGDIVVFTGDSSHDVTPLSITESCTLCHAPSLVAQHASRCDLCHQGSAPAAPLIGTWDKSCTASGCHAAVHASGPAANHDGMYWDSSASCALCHDTSGGDFPGPGDNCTRCHDPSYTAAAVGDHQPPTTTSNALAAYTGGASIHLTATDAGTSGVSVTWSSLNGGRWTIGTDVSVGAPVTGSRSYTLQFYSVDHARNAETTRSVAFTVSSVADTTAPVTTSSLSPAAGAIYRTTQTVTLTATDAASGVKATYYRIDTGAWTQATSFTVPEGLHTFGWYSVDNANNSEAIHTSNLFRVDTIAPVTTSSAVNGQTYVGGQTVTLTPADPGGSGVASTWYRLDGGALTAGSSIPIAAPASGSASHTLTWYSIDVATNQEATRTATFTVQAVVIDTTPPVTTSSFNPAANAVFKANQPVTLSATDNASGVKATYYRIDAAAFVQGTSFTVTGEGLHTFGWYSVDNNDNPETAHVSSTFRIDTIAPVTTNSAVAGATYTGGQTFTLTPSDVGGSGVASTAWALDGGGPASGTTVTVPAPASASASRTITWYSTDLAGNQEVAKSVTFTVAAPVVGGTTTISFRTSCDTGSSDWIYWQVQDASGTPIAGMEFSNDDCGHPATMWADFTVPSGVGYILYGEFSDYGGTIIDSATRTVTPAEATAGGTVTWLWH